MGVMMGSGYWELHIPSQLESGRWETAAKIVRLRFRNRHSPKILKGASQAVPDGHLSEMLVFH